MHIRWCPGLNFLIMCISSGCLGLAFQDWQPECAYPMFPGVCFRRLGIQMCISDFFLCFAFEIGNANMHIRCFLHQGFLYWESECAYPMVSGFKFLRLAIRMCISNCCLCSAFQDLQPDCAYPMFPGLCFLGLAIRMCMSEGFLGLAFKFGQAKCAYPMFPGFVFLRLAIRMCISDGVLGLAFLRLAIRMCISDVSWRKFS